MFNSKHSYADLLEGILIGGSLAAAATFIFGTEKGKELQKEAVEKCKVLKRKAKHYCGNLERAVKSPLAKKLTGLVKKTAKTKVVRKSVRKIKRKIASKRTVRR